MLGSRGGRESGSCRGGADGHSEHPASHCFQRLRLAGAARQVPASPGHGHGGQLLPFGAWQRLRRVCAADAGNEGWWRLGHRGQQVLDLKRSGGGGLRRLRECGSSEGPSWHHSLHRGQRQSWTAHREEGGQAGDTCVLHVRARAGGLPCSGRRSTWGGWPGLQDGHRPSQRGPHRHRRTDGGPGCRRLRLRGGLRLHAEAVRKARGRLPRPAVPVCAGQDGDRGRPRAGLQRGQAQGERRALCAGGSHGQAEGLGGGPERVLTVHRLARRCWLHERVHCGEVLP
mmetsp:Transcript_106432/g.343382  ORF Transcript_106432/g.343382 Transcript_106432/m.343382 type:complete len:285 (+) Transcript_106432:405-1259(+)